MAKVLWQRLILRGFGLYRDEFVIELGNNSVVALPNEAGKSTLVAGLAAVIFGLPATSDPTRFGQARYRNWYDPPAFNGELFFHAAGCDYHLTRDFSTHQVSLRYFAQGQWVQMPQATGIDNPSATRPFRAYRELLQQLLGISSLDLFLATFCITQPMPTPEGLDDAVQGLLAGAGGKATRVQQLLEAELKQITRFYGEPLGRTRGGNRDRKLEELRSEITELTALMEAGQASSAELQLVQARLMELSQERKLQQDLLAKRAATLQAWSEWRTQADRYQRGLGQQQRVEQALRRARQLELQSEQLGDQLGAYTLFSETEVDWEQFLEQQLERERELARLQRERAELQADLEQLIAQEEQTLRDYQARERTLAAGVNAAQEHHNQLLSKEETYKELEQDYRVRFGDLHLEPRALLAAVKQSGSRPRQKPAASGMAAAWASRVGGMLFGAISYWFWGRNAGLLGVGVALALGLLGWVLPILGGTSSQSDRGQDAVSQALARCPDLQATQSFLEQLLAAQATRPPMDALAAAQAALVEAQADLASCRGMITAFSNLETGGRSNIKNRLAAQQVQIEELTTRLADAAEHVVALGESPPIAWTALWKRYEDYCLVQQKLSEVQQAQAALWSAQQVEGLADLERRALDLQNNLAASRLAWQTLVDKNPGLPGLEPSHSGDTRHPQEQYEQLRAEINDLEKQLTALQQEEENLLRRRAQLEGQKPLNLAVAQEQLQELQQQEEQLSLEVEALGLAYRQLEAARIDYSASHRQRLAKQVSNYFQQITGQSQRRVELDADFAVTLRGDAGQTIYPVQLSQGARDQLYLSLRLAIADFLAEDVRLPLILDDPFVNCDSERLERIRQALAKVAETRQIWLLTHNAPLAPRLYLHAH